MALFGLFNLLFPMMFVLVFGTVIWVFIGAIRRERHNDRAPRLSVGARVVAKRQNFRRGTANSMGHTSYFATFEVESGDRMELRLSGEEYGLLAEGDRGIVQFQGTRFLGFERI